MEIDLSTTVGQNIFSPFTGNTVNRIGKDSQAPLVDIWPTRKYPEFDYLQILYVDKPEEIQWEISRYVEAGKVGCKFAATKISTKCWPSCSCVIMEG